MKKLLRLLAVFMIAIAVFAPSAIAEQEVQDYPFPCVSLPSSRGEICGIQNGDVYTYKGIKYATTSGGPATNDPRLVGLWQRSRLKQNYEGWVSATDYGAPCLQNGKAVSKAVREKSSNDCLFLNVWTTASPNVAPNEANKPVMVFIHGGAFEFGSAAEQVRATPFGDKIYLYDGTHFAKHGVVLVTINYRLGAAGYFYDESLDSIGGNFGIEDQVNALKWVRNNIKSFGGDPDKVTIFGESAGAMSVGLHLFSLSESAEPKHEHLFRAAIMESNPISIKYPNRQEAKDSACEFLQCLNSVITEGHKVKKCEGSSQIPSEFTAEDLFNAQSSYSMLKNEQTRLQKIGLPAELPFLPAIDGTYLTNQPQEGFGVKNTVPFIFGFNTNEGQLFSSLLYEQTFSLFKPFSNTYQSILEDLFSPDSVKGILKNPQYETVSPDRRTLPNVRRAGKLITDFVFVCGYPDKPSHLPSSGSSTQFWGYNFNQSPPLIYNLPVKVCSSRPKGGQKYVCHGAELAFVFETALDNASNGAKKLADKMNWGWVQFATNPHAAPPALGGSAWSPWSIANPQVQQLKSGDLHLVDPFQSSSQCGFWSKINLKKML